MGQEQERALRHELGNVKQEKEALKGVIAKAADELENLVDSDCEDQAKQDAQEAAEKLRKISKM